MADPVLRSTATAGADAQGGQTLGSAASRGVDAMKKAVDYANQARQFLKSRGEAGDTAVKKLSDARRSFNEDLADLRRQWQEFVEGQGVNAAQGGAITVDVSPNWLADP